LLARDEYSSATCIFFYLQGGRKWARGSLLGTELPISATPGCILDRNGHIFRWGIFTHYEKFIPEIPPDLACIFLDSCFLGLLLLLLFGFAINY
jgi:hypothetical protein